MPFGLTKNLKNLETNPEGEYYPFIISFLTDSNSLTVLNSSVILALLSIVVLLFLSALVSGSEVAYFSLNADDEDDLDKSDRKADKRILNLLKDDKYLLATILVSNNLFNVAIIILSYFSLDTIFHFIQHPALKFLLDVVLITFILVLFGEIIPKIFARSNAKTVARLSAGPLSLFSKIAYPLSYVLVNSTTLIENRLSQRADNEVDIDEIEDAIDLTINSDNLKDENRTLKGIINFGNTSSKEIMKPRMDIVALDLELPFDKVHEVLIESGYSRIPAYKEDLDNIEGILYAKDVLEYLQREKTFKWQKLLRKTFFVPETKKIDDLLREFQVKRTHLAIVIDEYGGTMGLITMEDILEEVLGEIKDEYDDNVEIEYQKIDNHNYTFEGKTLINDLTKVMEIDNDTFEEVKGDADSLAGLILEITGKLPKQNQEVVHENFVFNVLSVSDNRIEQVKITIAENDHIT